MPTTSTDAKDDVIDVEFEEESPAKTPAKSKAPRKRTAKAAPAETATDTPFVKTLWLAGPPPLCPQPTIFIPGRAKPYKFNEGHLTITNESDYQFVLQACRGESFEEDWPEDKAPIMDDVSGYAPRSYEALRAHQRLLGPNR